MRAFIRLFSTPTTLLILSLSKIFENYLNEYGSDDKINLQN
jgi:hypothetical protein